MSNYGITLVFVCVCPARISRSGDCAHRIRRGKSACASRTEKVHRAWAEVQGVPFRKRGTVLQRQRRSEAFSTSIDASLKDKAMGLSTIFSCRRIVLKVFLVHFVAFQATYAAPSPIIRFPGDDTPKTDKEVALVSSRNISKKFPSYLRSTNRWHGYWMVGCLSDWLIGWLVGWL